MSTRNRAFLAAALLMVSSVARSDGISNFGNLDVGFTGGISGNGGAAVVVGCASPTAPNGVVDLSQCSNAFYAAVIF